MSFVRLVRAMGGYSIPMLLSRCMSIIMLPLYIHYLRPKDYAVLDLLDLFGNIVGALIGLRLGSALFYFYFHADGERDQARYVTTALVGAAVLGVCTAAVVFPAASAFSAFVMGDASYAALFRIFILSVGASLPVEAGCSYLLVRDRSRAYTVILTIRLIASLVLNVVFLAFFRLGPASILWTNLVANVCFAAYFGWSILSTIPLYFGRHHFVELVRYSAPLGLSSLGELGLHFGDRIFLRPNVSLSLLGIYGLAYKIGMLVAYASGPFFTYWNAQMVGIVRAPNGERLYARTATYLFLGLGYIALLATVFAHPALAIAATPDYWPAAAFIPLIALAYVIRGMGSYFLNTFLLDKRSADVARITWIATAVCLAGYSVLIPRYRLWGAVAATLAGFSVIFVAGLWKSQQARPLPYEYGRWVKLVLAGAIVVTGYELLQLATLWQQVAAGVAAAILYPAVLILLGFLNREERQGLKHGWAMIMAKAKAA